MLDSDESISNYISRIIPPIDLAYSILFTDPRHAMEISELQKAMLRFPRGDNTRGIRLNELLSQQLGFSSIGNILRDPIGKFVTFSIPTLRSALEKEPFFEVDGDTVLLKVVNDIDVKNTLQCLRQIYPNYNETMWKEEARKGFVHYFHYVHLSDNEIIFPALQNRESFLSFSGIPDPETALACVFLYAQRPRISIEEYLELQFSVCIRCSNEEPFCIGRAIGDISSVITNSHLFYVDHGTIVFQPPLIVSRPGAFHENFMYQRKNDPIIKREESLGSQTPTIRDLIPSIVDIFGGYLDSLKKLLRPGSTFTQQEIEEYVTAQYCANEVVPSVPSDLKGILKKEIVDWIANNAEVTSSRDIPKPMKVKRATPEAMHAVAPIIKEIARTHRYVHIPSRPITVTAEFTYKLK